MVSEWQRPGSSALATLSDEELRVEKNAPGVFWHVRGRSPTPRVRAGRLLDSPSGSALHSGTSFRGLRTRTTARSVDSRSDQPQRSEGVHGVVPQRVRHDDLVWQVQPRRRTHLPGRFRADEGNRTPVFSLGSFGVSAAAWQLTWSYVIRWARTRGCVQPTCNYQRSGVRGHVACAAAVAARPLRDGRECVDYVGRTPLRLSAWHERSRTTVLRLTVRSPSIVTP
jgi:hypothetical protein